MKESWIIDQLAQQGVTHFCIAPGARNTPLMVAAASHKKALIHTHYDERGLGFYALGIGKATRKPAAVIVTSGTALGNLLPSVMEAHHSFTPLLLLTADRPPELRDCGANQTTDQVKIFSPFLRWEVDLTGPLQESYFRSAISQGFFFTSQNPPGPVQINCPFEEPLYRPNPSFGTANPLAIHLPRLRAKPFRTAESKGLILVGSLPDPTDIAPILKLAERLQWPICADILSNARCFPTKEQVNNFDWFEKPKPTFVLHFGERLTSKRLLEWLQELKVEYIHVSPYPALQDPARILTARVQSDIGEFCETFEGGLDPNWLGQWENGELLFEEGGAFTEVHAMRAISEWLPPDFTVFLGNSMPIRDADHFLFPKQCRGFFANRGLSGIDGNIATLAGLAEEGPVLGVIGDQTALHDLNSMPLLKKTKFPAILLILNNFGGGIFHHLPVSQSPHFEALWGAAHEFRFEAAAHLFQIPYLPFQTLPEILRKGTSAVVELITDRTKNYEYQKRLKPCSLARR